MKSANRRVTSGHLRGDGEQVLAAARWFSAAPVLRALDPSDLEPFRATARTSAQALLPVAREAPAVVSIFLFDLLRQIAERLSFGGGEPAEEQKIAWMNGLGGQEDPAEIIRFYLAELDLLLEVATSSSRRINPIILRARRFIETHHAEQISLSRVAEELQVARNYLSSLFRKECDQTLTEYIHQVRIEHAKKLLRNRALSLGQVARDVGYRNYRHFYRSFLRICETSPTDFVRGGPGPVPPASTPSRLPEEPLAPPRSPSIGPSHRL